MARLAATEMRCPDRSCPSAELPCPQARAGRRGYGLALPAAAPRSGGSGRERARAVRSKVNCSPRFLPRSASSPRRPRRSRVRARVGDLLRVVGVEEQAGVADQVRQAGGGRAGDGQPRGERLADGQPPALEAAREDEAGGQLVERAQLERADEARERCSSREAELRDPFADAPEVAVARPGQTSGIVDAAPASRQRECLEQALVVLVRPGLGRVEQEASPAAQPGPQRARGPPRVGSGYSQSTDPPGTTATFSSGQAVALDQVAGPRRSSRPRSRPDRSGCGRCARGGGAPSALKAPAGGGAAGRGAGRCWERR